MTKRYHIDLDKKSIRGARLAVLPGDPFRSGVIARAVDEAYGGGVEELAWKREYSSFLAFLNGKPVVVCSTGIGGPSASIAIEELASIGVRDFLRIGTTGAIQDSIKIGDVVVTTGSVRLDGASTHYAPIEFPAVADHNITSALVEGAKRAGLACHTGVTASSDTFYQGEERSDSFRSYTLRRLKGSREEWKRLGVLNYDMESSTVLTLCASMGLRGGSVTGVVNVAGRGRITQKGLKKGESAAINAATAALGILIYP